MPAFETMFNELVVTLRDPDKVAQLQRLLDDEVSLADIVDELGLMQHGGQKEFIAAAPASMQAAILAVARENLARDEPKQMMFTWAPGYDWELHMWESTASTVSEGGITMQVRSRYPGDAHPGIVAS
ncbi:MAG: hypothetical protein ABJC79_08515 [Acidimicrobiia bacterium]